MAKRAISSLRSPLDNLAEGLKNPKLAAGDRIIALPTLGRQRPSPMKKTIGDLSNEHRVLVGLDLCPH
jgi:circadian clock protein KaiB